MKNFFFNFLLLICDNYLPLEPTQNDWPNRPPQPPPGGTPTSSTVHKTKYTLYHTDFDYFHIYGGKWGIKRHILSWRRSEANKAKKLAKERPKFPKMGNFWFFSLDYWESWISDYFSLLTFSSILLFEFLAFFGPKGQNFKNKFQEKCQ